VFLDQGTTEVYDLAKDPDEASNVASTPDGKAFVSASAAARSRIFGDRMAAELWQGTLAASPDQLNALKGLGYVSSTGASGKPLRRVDLRAFAGELSKLQEARELLSARRYDEALARYDAFLRAFPDSSLAHQERGQALRSMGRLDIAETAFARAIALDPRDAVSLIALGNIALARERFDVAEKFFRESVAVDEGLSEAHLNLGLLYLYKLGRPSEATPHLRRFLELEPTDPEAPQIRRIVDQIAEKSAARSGKTP
jgi:tetratricopeptide (TPR) repeat protein